MDTVVQVLFFKKVHIFYLNLEKRIEADVKTYKIKKIILNENQEYALSLRNKLNLTTKKLFVLVNPYAGKGKGTKIAKQKIEPLLKRLQVDYKIEYTKNPLHAEEIAFNLETNEYLGALIVGGDGVVNEFLNGLIKRSVFDFPVAHCAAGSGCGLSCSLNMLDVNVAIWSCLRGKTMKMDMFKVKIGQKSRYCFLSLTTAYIAQVDLGSEHLRFLGPIRMDLCALYYVFFQKRKTYKLSFVKENDEFVELQPKKYFFLSLFNAPFISRDYRASLSRLDSKLMQLVYAEKITKFSFLRALMQQKSGNYLKLGEFKSVMVKRVILEIVDENLNVSPLNLKKNSFMGYLSLDGEQAFGQKIEAEIYPQLCTVFVPLK